MSIFSEKDKNITILKRVVMISKNSLSQLNEILSGGSRDPFAVLGMHTQKQATDTVVSVKVFQPFADEIHILDLESETKHQMNQIHEDGLFEIIFPRKNEIFEYKVLIKVGDTEIEYYDPYSFLPQISDYDKHLFFEGSNYKSFEKLGAHLQTVKNIEGVSFILWAPFARSVSVVGDFNHWKSGIHQMRNLGESGLWEIFIPGVVEGVAYKYQLKTSDNRIVLKADPYGFCMQEAPETSSIICNINKHQWNDAKWMKNRETVDSAKEAMSIYEVHLGSWLRNDGNTMLDYKSLAHHLVKYCKEMSYTHIELLPISEHPFYGSWGYQIIGYYSVTSRYGTPEDFMYFVDYCHQNDIAVILDWVPAHFPKDDHGLSKFDGTCLYEHEDPRQGEQLDWGTLVYNYGRPEVKSFLISNLVFFIEKFHIDGFRIDAVASMLYLNYSRPDGYWIPNKFGGHENLEAIEFIRDFNNVIHDNYKGVITIAEESTSWPMVSRPTHLGGLGFDFKWNMGWMIDMLDFMSMDPIYRSAHLGKLTFGIYYAFNENFVLVLSHDEVVHGKYSLLNKMSGDLPQKFANLRVFYGYMMAHPGKKLLFMGGDFGQQIEWNHDQGLDWHLLNYPSHKSLHDFYKDLNKLYQKSPSMHKIDFKSDGFEWIDFSDTEKCIVSFMRKTDDPRESLLFFFNFTPVTRYDYRIGLPWFCDYQEIMNSNSKFYGGDNEGNSGEIKAQKIWAQSQAFSVEVTLPGLSMIVLKPLGAPKPNFTYDGDKMLKVFTMPKNILMPVPSKKKSKKKAISKKISKKK